MATPVPPPPTPPQSGSSNLGIAPNLGGLLCYLPCCPLGLIFSIVVVLVEKQNRFMRFHAFQSLLFHAALVVLGVGFMILSVILGAIHLSLLLIPIQFLLGMALLVLDIFLMIKAYNNEQYELPTLGAMAKGWV